MSHERRSTSEVDKVEMEAEVIETLPNALYRVELRTGGRPRVVAHVGGAAGLLRVHPGDTVVVEVLPFDVQRARIVRRK